MDEFIPKIIQSTSSDCAESTTFPATAPALARSTDVRYLRKDEAVVDQNN